MIFPLGLLALALATLAVFLVRRRSGPEPAVVAAADPEPEPRPVWKPWRQSTMDGPGWTADPPPSREGSWAAAPAKEPEPPPAAPSQETWAEPPSSGRPARR